MSEADRWLPLNNRSPTALYVKYQGCDTLRVYIDLLEEFFYES